MLQLRLARLLLILMLLGLLIAIGDRFREWSVTDPAVTATYVGGERCATCHQEQYRAWHGSHHDRALEEARPETVLGNFQDCTLEHKGVTSRMFRRGEEYWIETEGPNGEPQEFQVRYVIGCRPLQQYLVQLKPPVEDDPQRLGTLQVLRLSWDTQQRRWLHVDPPDVHERLSTDDPLHWTGPAQNWNHMCAACHSTDVRKGFDLNSNRFGTTYSEIDVSCEACHGPGSRHVDWAETSWWLRSREPPPGLLALKGGSAELEIETCAPCHSRRRSIFPGFQPGKAFGDHYVAELIRPELYYPDGQIRDEVFEYGSFLQSRMHQQGVRCTDCHDPHTARLKSTGNQLCTSCHQHDPARYDTPAHHHHTPGSTGSLCVECHMPATPFMEIHFRRDHSLRIPRPDLSMTLHTPNACTGCHLELDPQSDYRPQTTPRWRPTVYADWMAAAQGGDRIAAGILHTRDTWAAKAVSEWRQPARAEQTRRPSDFAETFAPYWRGIRPTDGGHQLARMVVDRRYPAIVRGSAAELLASVDTAALISVAGRSLRDPSPLVRTALAQALDAHHEPSRQYLLDCLKDSIRSVRFAAMRNLLELPEQLFTAQQLQARDAVLQELSLAAHEDLDQSAAHVLLATVAEHHGQMTRAIQHYRDAIRIRPREVGARSNLAALLETMHQPQAARQLRVEELSLLQRDASLAPRNPDALYRLAMAQYLLDQAPEAEATLLRVAELEPHQQRSILFLALLYEKQRRWNEAADRTRKLLQWEPGNPVYRQMYDRFRALQAAE